MKKDVAHQQILASSNTEVPLRGKERGPARERKKSRRVAWAVPLRSFSVCVIRSSDSCLLARSNQKPIREPLCTYFWELLIPGEIASNLRSYI